MYKILGKNTTKIWYYFLGEANQSVNVLFQLNESDLEVIDQLSSLYLALDQTDYAEQMLRKGLHLDGKNIALLYNKARLHNRRQENAEVVDAVEAAMMQGDTQKTLNSGNTASSGFGS